jgi:predicted metal-dependent hydrolase
MPPAPSSRDLVSGRVRNIDPPSAILRSPSFEFDPKRAGDWCAGSALQSHLLNGLSAFLPSGEAFFVQAMNLNPLPTSNVDENWRETLSLFAKQESNHLRQHKLYNDAVATCYPTFGRFLHYLDFGWLVVSRLSSRRMRLAFTVAIEHATAIFARTVLGSAEFFGSSDPEYEALWRWHSLEELEHKRVAFDLYQATGGGRLRLRAAMVIMCISFGLEYGFIVCRLLAADHKLWRRQTWVSLANILGAAEAKAARRALTAFFHAEFDPDDVDDRHLIDRAKGDPLIVERLVAG